MKLSKNAYKLIKDFYHRGLSEEQELIIDKIFKNKEQKECYKKYGLCEECKRPNTGTHFLIGWCQACNAKRFQRNFNKWTSENYKIDSFIRNAQVNAKSNRQVIEWIDFNQFKNLQYLNHGGFGLAYKATWKGGYIQFWDGKDRQWKRERYDIYGEEIDVVLKYLHDSKDITVEFLRELESHLVATDDNDSVLRCFGITRDSITKDYMLVMEYARNGSIRQHLNYNFHAMNYERKLFILKSIAICLKNIHDNGLIHYNFHPGNVLCKYIGSDNFNITDLGIHRPANLFDDRIYGVLPYVAPEVLREKRYSQASDIYAFGILAFEICSGLPPYYIAAHDGFLAAKICEGWRPTSDFKIPPLILDVITRCWDADPLKRPSASQVLESFNSMSAGGIQWELFNKQCAKVDQINKHLFLSPPVLPDGVLLYKIHPRAVYTSRPLDFKDLPEPKNSDDNNFLETESIMDTIRYVLAKKSKQVNQLSKL